MQLISILKVQHHATHVVERAKILEFFTLVAEMCEFDAEFVGRLLVAPWEEEAAQMASIYSQGYICNSERETGQEKKTLTLS